MYLYNFNYLSMCFLDDFRSLITYYLPQFSIFYACAHIYLFIVHRFHSFFTENKITIKCDTQMEQNLGFTINKFSISIKNNYEKYLFILNYTRLTLVLVYTTKSTMAIQNKNTILNLLPVYMYVERGILCTQFHIDFNSMLII